MQLKRFADNPILSPSKKWWEFKAVFNPGVALYNDKITLLYRAIGGDGLSRFGLATSQDGISFERAAEPVFEGGIDSPYERLGVEDPRIVKIENTYYITYNAASVYPASEFKKVSLAPSLYHPAPWRFRPSLITTKDFRDFEHQGILLSEDSKDATLFPEKIAGKFALLHRVYPNIYLSFSEDLKNWSEKKVLLTPHKASWDSERVGAGSQPIKTEKGWVIFYHGVSEKHQYRMGLLVLDLADPGKIIFRSSEPILLPEESYERSGLTAEVVFTCGALEVGEEFFVYYGAADKCIGLATITKKQLLSF
ncbi:MAG: glycosidase [bacterium]|nr:glycosidase [bacterium]